MSSFVADFAGINGANALRKVQVPDLVRAFNAFVETYFPESSYREKPCALWKVVKSCVYSMMNRLLIVLKADTTLPFPAFKRLHGELKANKRLLTDEPTPPPVNPMVARTTFLVTVKTASTALLVALTIATSLRLAILMVRLSSARYV